MTPTKCPAPYLVPDDDPGDNERTHALRALYAAPDSDGYWSALEQRIMDRIAGGETLGAWWSVSAQWARIGLIAAGILDRSVCHPPTWCRPTRNIRPQPRIMIPAWIESV